MDVFWITFRVADATIGARTYTTRYNALVAALTAHCVDAWQEPTSFLLLKSDSSVAQIAAAVKGAIATTVDLVVIGSMNYTGITVVGDVDNVDQLLALEARVTWA